MNRLYIFAFVLSFGFLSVQADKKILKEAKTAIKTGGGLENAEKKLLEAVEKIEKQDKKAEYYYLAGLIQKRINNGENEKLYLKQNYDTVKFFNTIYNMFQRFRQCDSIEAIPDEKGRTKFKYRLKSHDLLLGYRANLMNAGKFYMRKNNYSEAFRFLDLYLDCANYPMFKKDFFLQKDTLVTKAAYWATLAAYNLKNAKNTLKYADLSLVDTRNRKYLLEYKAVAYKSLKDTAQWIDALKIGLTNFPDHDYFFANLMDYFNETQNYDEALQFVNSMLALDNKNPLFWYARSIVMMNTFRYEDCIASCDSVLALDTAYVDAYYNKGISYCNLAVIATEKSTKKINDPQYKKVRAKIKELYSFARPPLEMVRKYEPENKIRWATPLYRVYLNLNMGKEFDEMDRILKSIK